MLNKLLVVVLLLPGNPSGAMGAYLLSTRTSSRKVPAAPVFLVFDEVRHEAESFSAMFTLKGLFPCVDLLVFLTGISSIKGSFIKCTSVATFTLEKWLVLHWWRGCAHSRNNVSLGGLSSDL